MENIEEVLIMSDSGYPTSDHSDRQSGAQTRAPPYYSTSRSSGQQWYTGANGKLKFSGSGNSLLNGHKMMSTVPLEKSKDKNVAEVKHLPYGYGGYNPSKNVVQQELLPNDEERRQVQIQAYVVWVNAQLKKKPGTRLIEDLTSDMHDGVALVDLIEVVGGEKLDCVYRSPANRAEKITNVESVLQFMARRRIRMHQTSASDIVNGNVKSVMRLVLALAAHFKPSSVKATTGMQKQSIAVLAQGAAVALASARQHAENVPSQRSASYASSPSAVTRFNQDRYVNNRDRFVFNGDVMQTTQASVPRSNSTDPSRMSEDKAVQASNGDDIICSDESFSLDLEQTKQALLALQALLLNGQLPDDADDRYNVSIMETSSSQEEVIVLRSQLQQLSNANVQLRDDLTRLKTENLHLSGSKIGLQQRLSEQESLVLQLQSDLLRTSLAQKNSETIKAELEIKICECDRIISELQKALAIQVQQNEELRATLRICQQENAISSRSIKSEVIDLHSRIQGVGKSEVALSSSIASQGRRLAKLEDDILQSQLDVNTKARASHSRRNTYRSSSVDTDDLHLVRESLQSLRSFTPGNLQQHAIDTLERSIASLIDRLEVSERQVSHNRINSQGADLDNSNSWNGGQSDISLNQHFYDSSIADSTLKFQSNILEEKKKGMQSSTENLPSANRNMLHGAPLNTQGSGASTKILYFTEKTVAPFACTIYKSAGEITLKDFKNAIDRPGRFRYHFKANDPDFGTVKEEVVQDDALVPHWEGKVVAWLQEDHGG